MSKEILIVPIFEETDSGSYIGHSAESEA